MTTFYRIVLSALPFLLLWVWAVNMAPDLSMWAYTTLGLLYMGFGLTEYAKGVRRGVLIGHVIITKIVADLKDILTDKPE